MKNAGYIAAAILLSIFLSTLLSGCALFGSADDDAAAYDLDSIQSRGVIDVLTLSSSTSYFYYKGEERGYEYELVKRFADDMGLEVNVIVADNVNKLTQMLLDSVGDIIAYDMPLTGDTKRLMLHCGPERISEQVVVQRADNPITDVVELVGKEVHVERGSKYEERLRNLNNELGGGIHIIPTHNDTLTTEDLIGMVSKGEIAYTLADENLARINRTYYNNIDIYIKASFAQRSQWAVRKEMTRLAAAADAWAQEHNNSQAIQAINKRYFEMGKNIQSSSIMSIVDGRISAYDEIFKQEAAVIEWDWRLLAAMAYHESRFESGVVSWVGARGIMQLMPATAAAFGLSIDSIEDPALNVRAAVRSMQSLENSLKSIEDPEEKIKFVVAAYNSGIGHVFDAMALAREYGKDAQRWYGEVEEAMLMKSNPEYYNSEVCRFGYFRGKETTGYVRDVMALYDYYCKKIAK